MENWRNFIITGFFLLIGVAGNSDYAAECRIYHPWYSGWQLLLAGLISLIAGTALLKDWSEKHDR